MRYIKAVVLLALSFTIFYFLHYRHGQVPPLGKFLNPFTGFWQNNTATDMIPRTIYARQLRDSVSVIWDERRVPHIFADNLYDLYFAQGFITARDRLWQMEFQTDAIAGRLAEILGIDFLQYDIFYRRCGIVYAAENALKEMLSEPETRLILEAYTDGVNAYIKTLNEKSLPLEYKILDYEPRPWTFLKSALVSKFMAWHLSAFDYPELNLSRARAVLGEAETDRLYPAIPPFSDPVIPLRTPWQFKTVRLPTRPISVFLPILDTLQTKEKDVGELGSNNWAVASSRTATGGPILCNDLHLPLYLPSIWYEIQLAIPEMNVYGASLPGAPLILVGFNDYVAWGATNAMADVLDWYEIEFKDERESAYLHDGKWLPTRKRIEEISIRDDEKYVDTVVYTKHGPLVCHTNETPFDIRVPRGAAMRWIGHDPSNPLRTFLELNRARDYDACVAALAHHDCPGQNFAFACKEGDIAIWHAGKFPIRWPMQGRYICDGRNSEYDWHGWIPTEQLPHILSPRRGFVSSANQYPVDISYPYYVGGLYWSFDRGARINEQLINMRSSTVEEMVDLQNDVLDLTAQMILPFLLSELDAQKLILQERESYDELKDWDYECRAGQVAPTIFAYWWEDLSALIWSDELHTAYGDITLPRADATVALILNTPDSPYFDIRYTPDHESLKDLVVRSFHSANNRLFADLGRFGENWQWGRARPVSIVHLGQIRGMDRSHLFKGGSQFTINVKHPLMGRSWRMVIALGPQMKGWGIYPGGQSGNPGSMFYDSFVDDWLADKTYEFLFLDSPLVEHERLVARTVMRRQN